MMDLMTKVPDSLIKVKDFGIEGYSYYWVNREKFNIRKSELIAANVFSEDCYISELIVAPLKRANKSLKKYGYKLFIKDGYRPVEVYDLAYTKRQNAGTKNDTSTLLNLAKRPHSSGRSVDVVLCSIKNGRELLMRDDKDGIQASFIDFYKSKDSKKANLFQERQILLRKIMESSGFCLGSKKEYWHFEYNT